MLAAVTHTVPAASFTLYRRWALRPEVIVAGGAIWDHFASLSAAGTGGSAVFVPKRLGAYRLSPAGITATGGSRRAGADYALSQLRGVCWLIRAPGGRRFWRGLAGELVLQWARALKASATARDPWTAIHATLALCGFDLLRPAPWPRR
jgi:hypothetical protein